MELAEGLRNLTREELEILVGEILPICCNCSKDKPGGDSNAVNGQAVRISGQWVRRQDAPVLYELISKLYYGKLSHTYCPECEARFNAELDRAFKSEDI